MILRRLGALAAEQAVRKTYKILTQECLIRRLEFPTRDVANREIPGARAELSDKAVDPSCMEYRHVDVCLFGLQHWLIGLGSRVNLSQVDDTVCDIMAIHAIDSDLNFLAGFRLGEITRLGERVARENQFLKSSLVTVSSTGILKLRDKKLESIIGPDIALYVVKKKEIRWDSATGNSNFVGYACKFNRNFPEFLAEKIAIRLSLGLVKGGSSRSPAA